ncbi:hypothetical protein ACS0TY_033379 [Phlomoides rotata]
MMRTNISFFQRLREICCSAEQTKFARQSDPKELAVGTSSAVVILDVDPWAVSVDTDLKRTWLEEAESVSIKPNCSSITHRKSWTLECGQQLKLKAQSKSAAQIALSSEVHDDLKSSPPAEVVSKGM